MGGAAGAGVAAGATGFIAAGGYSAGLGASFTGGFTVGGITVTAGRVGTGPAGALATTAPAGGFEAIAGAFGGTMAGAGRGWGTILRGSGRAGAAVAVGALAAGVAGWAEGFGATVGALLGGTKLLRASASSSFFLARIAFITSPGFDTWDRSILGVMTWEAREDAALPA